MRKSILGWLSAIIFCGIFFTLASCDQMDSPTPQPVEPEDEYDKVVITDTTVLEKTLMGIKSQYVRVNYTYYSLDVDELTPLKLSSALVFSKDLFDREAAMFVDNDKQYDAAGLMLTPHFTIACAKEAPTQSVDMELEGAICALTSVAGLNYIQVSPDFSGFGVTQEKPQAYMMGDVTARQALDGLEAAKKALKKMGYTYAPKQVLVGYSQGGHTAMAIQRLLSMTSVVQPFDITCAGGGPFNLTAMVDSILLPGAKTRYPCAIPLMLVETGTALNMGLDYNKVFREPLGQKMVEWIQSKKLTTTQINDSICKILNVKLEDGVTVSDVLNTDYVKRGNEAVKPFFDVMEENSLVKGWAPISPSRFFIYHSVEDQVVPFFCFEHMRNFMTAIGDPGLDIDYTESLGNHQGAANMFVAEVIANLLLEED